MLRLPSRSLSPPPPRRTRSGSTSPSNFKFTPSTIRLKAGHHYILHLTSTGGHSFEAKAFFAAAKVDPADAAKLKAGRIELDEGEAIDIHFTAPGAGSFPVRCTHFLHSTWGMTGTITVG